MKLIIMALLAFSVSFATAQVVDTVEKTQTESFRIDSRTDFGGRVYYACESVEHKTEALLKELGAYDISVRCSGGIDPWGGYAREAFVKTTFTVKSENAQGDQDGSYEEFEFKSFGSCHLYSEVFSQVKDAFEFERLDKVRRCFRSNDRITISGSVLK
ncbi:MAG: hypothetical protein WD025_06840 [Bacteriovoracaceae bacterium]